MSRHRTTITDVCASTREGDGVRERRRAIAHLDERDFDLVISDIKMPDKTGYDVFAAARKKSQTIPVIS